MCSHLNQLSNVNHLLTFDFNLIILQALEQGISSKKILFMTSDKNLNKVQNVPQFSPRLKANDQS